MSEDFARFKSRMSQLVRLSQAASLLGWDQQTYMPPGAAAARGEQAAALSSLVHSMFVSTETEQLLVAAERALEGEDPATDEARMAAVVRHDFDLSTKVPADLVAEMARHRAIAHSIWVKARQNNDFKAFAPALEKTLGLVRRRAECLGYTDHIYDPLLNMFERGMKHAQVAAVFAQIRPDLVALTRRIAESRSEIDDSLLRGDFPIDVQRRTTLELAAVFGFDLACGRQDEAIHPFCGGSDRTDVRITTRFDPKFLGQALYATFHETGHGLYEQGLPEEHAGTPLCASASLGIHESQSRMWENLVGRSRRYCKFVLPKLQAAFPQALSGATPEALYRAVNQVRPSFIRVEADEVTYNLHIMFRFEIESDLLTGALAVSDLPQVWNERVEEYLGVTPTSDAVGVLQDVHWSEGLVGYFPTYALGNLISGQLWNTIRGAVPDIDDQIEQGKFADLLGWLRENIHTKGRRYLPMELLEQVTGEPLSPKYYLDYLKTKYEDLYALNA